MPLLLLLLRRMVLLQILLLLLVLFLLLILLLSFLLQVILHSFYEIVKLSVSISFLKPKTGATAYIISCPEYDITFFAYLYLDRE